MTTPEDRGDRDTTDAAEVVHLDAARVRRTPAPPPDHADTPDGHTDDTAPDTETGAGAGQAPDTAADTTADTNPAAAADTTDTDRPAERPDTGTPDGPVLEGEVVRVDRPDIEPGDWLADLAERAKTRRPIVPLWLRSRAEATDTARWVGVHYAHVAGYHLARLPKYAAKMAARSPRGTFRLVAGLVRWTFDLEGEPVRLATVQKADPEQYLKLSRQRDARVRLRVWVSGLAVLAVTAAGVAVALAPAPARWVALAVTVAALGVLGRVPDRPLIDRAVVPARVEKLTSDIVIRALGSLGISAINQAISKNPHNPIDFLFSIGRDGPGYRADLNLPFGVTVDDIVERRKQLASGLRRPLGAVWPEQVSEDHPGRMVLWVGDEAMAKAKQPGWPLLRTGQVDLFKPAPFATDQRGRWAKVTLMYVSVVIGSLPRMGKTFLLRLLCLIAALDPRAELHLYDLKGTGDLSALEPVAYRYRAGEDDDDIAYALAGMRDLREEMRRRTKVIRDLPKDVCRENKVTPELASKKSLRLHPIVVAVDECQVWFEDRDHGEEFTAICTDLVKRGPALGIILILATQRPDAKSLPTGISANAALRLCLKVMGHMENDMVLGTGAHKAGIRATMFAFSDKGICYFSGEGDNPRIVRSAFLDAPAAEKVALRARALREHAGTLAGHALGEEFTSDTGPAYDLLADVLAVVPPGEPKLWNETVVTRLAELRPEVYGPWADLDPDVRSAQLTTALKPYGIRTGQVWGTTGDGTGQQRGANRRGITRDDIHHTITQRNQNGGGGGR